VNRELSPEALELGMHARRALEAAGGDSLSPRAAADPALREKLVAPALEGLGAWDLDVRAGSDELEAGAALCRAAGWWAAPYPVAERLTRPRDLDVTGLLVVDGDAPLAPLHGLTGEWLAVTLDGRRRRAATSLDARIDVSDDRGFVLPLALGADEGVATVADLALGLVLPCWTLLGLLDRALDLTCTHAATRQQFGQPLAALQGVQFQLTDAEVERAGLDELARYALWSIASGCAEMLEDALATRVAALDAARVVLRVAHQVHGASGFCDDTMISWVSRASDPIRRLPVGSSGTLAQLTAIVGTRGITGLFSADARRI
jgi:hypothetical protein